MQPLHLEWAVAPHNSLLVDISHTQPRCHEAQLPQEGPTQQHRRCLEHCRLPEASAPSNPGVVEVIFLPEQLVALICVHIVVKYTLLWCILAFDVNALDAREAVANALPADR
jgi:hypothetical protein